MRWISRSSGGNSTAASVRRADREAPLGTGGIERFGGRNDAPDPGQNVRDRLGQFDGARGRNHALRGAQKQGIVEQQTQPVQAVADRRRRQMKALRRLADMPLRQHGLKHRQQIQVGITEMNFIQHMLEIIS